MKPNDRDKRRYDIYIADAHRDGDAMSTIKGSANLTFDQMVDWVFHGGDWYFEVIPHGKERIPENVILRGTTYGEKCEHVWYKFTDRGGVRWEACRNCDARRHVREKQ